MLGRVSSAPAFLRASFSIVVVLLINCILTSLLVGPWCGQSILTTGRYWKRWPRWAQRRRKMCYRTWISTLPISVPTGTSFRKVRRWKETSYRVIDGKEKNYHSNNRGSLLSFFNCLYIYMHMQYFDNLRGHRPRLTVLPQFHGWLFRACMVTQLTWHWIRLIPNYRSLHVQHVTHTSRPACVS